MTVPCSQKCMTEARSFGEGWEVLCNVTRNESRHNRLSSPLPHWNVMRCGCVVGGGGLDTGAITSSARRIQSSSSTPHIHDLARYPHIHTCPHRRCTRIISSSLRQTPISLSSHSRPCSIHFAHRPVHHGAEEGVCGVVKARLVQ